MKGAQRPGIQLQMRFLRLGIKGHLSTLCSAVTAGPEEVPSPALSALLSF